MAGLVPAIPIERAQPCPVNRDRRIKSGDDEWQANNTSTGVNFNVS
jgi:hypothetical protein